MIITEVIMLVLRLQNNNYKIKKKKSLVIMLTGTHTRVCSVNTNFPFLIPNNPMLHLGLPSSS